MCVCVCVLMCVCACGRVCDRWKQTDIQTGSDGDGAMITLRELCWLASNICVTRPPSGPHLSSHSAPRLILPLRFNRALTLTFPSLSLSLLAELKHNSASCCTHRAHNFHKQQHNPRHNEWKHLHIQKRFNSMSLRGLFIVRTERIATTLSLWRKARRNT